ncbi:predicted protein [Histoplasma capsulatum G186AR]|uniref:Uncharacterized protein n=1 Tax=Ajellomyces capsulatus (strain G186AR / H82 / ATCC MYA-2454 / RMSCC 2432) TaxID=447093 RepID=C0NY30_AJECG|nr:uncharacterized protein HCBG_07824 [Histoplasma capsulatum G186AR]EEH03697.1 predicted protein [Histoplasma capsulatum G186AR]
MEAGSKEIKLGMRRKEEHRQQREKSGLTRKIQAVLQVYNLQDRFGTPGMNKRSSLISHQPPNIKADPTIWPSLYQEASIRECSRDFSQLQGTAQDLGDLQDGKVFFDTGGLPPAAWSLVVEMSLSKVGVSGYIPPLGLLPVCIGRQRAASGWFHGANKRSVGTP